MKKKHAVNITLTDQINEYAKHFAEHLTKGNKSKLIADAIFYYTQGNANIKMCPTCKNPVFDLEKMPFNEGIASISCNDNHEHYFDFKEDKWVR